MELEHKKNEAIGYLENADYARADELFAEIARRLPQERLGLQNLAICRLLAFEADRGEAAVAMESVNELMDRFPKSATARLLASRVHLALMASSRSEARRKEYLRAAYEVLERAIALERSSPARQAVPRYAFYEAFRYSDDPEVKNRARKILEDVYRQIPDNLFVVVDWLDEQAQMRDRSITNTLQSARKSVEPCRDSIRLRAGVDVYEYIDEAARAALAGDWPTVVANTRTVGHLVRPEECAQRDKKLISLHPLGYAWHRFSDSFYLGLPSGLASPSENMVVRLVPLPAEQQPPPLSDIRDLAVADLDLDGMLDLVILQEDRLIVMRREGTDGAWSPAFESSLPAGMVRILLADLDRDDARPSRAGEGEADAALPAPPNPSSDERVEPCHEADLDVVVYGAAGARIYRNDLGSQPGKRVLTLIEQGEGFLSLTGIRSGELIDLDHDGDMDLVLASSSRVSLWSNRGNLTFLDVSRWSLLPPSDSEYTHMFAVDWDRDADLDVLIAGPNENSTGLLENMLHGQLHWRPLRRTVGRLAVAPEDIALLEHDGNGSWDLVVAGAEGMQLIGTRSPRPGIVTPLAKLMVTEQPCRLLATWDCDNDGYTDLLVTSSDGVRVLRGGFDGKFPPAPGVFSEAPAGASRIVPADLDEDGDLDLALAAPDGVVLYSNEGGNKNHWLQVRVRGDADKRCGRVNHYGLGGVLEVRIGTTCLYQVVCSPVTHFGLGQVERADVVRAVMTDGNPQAVVRPESNRTYCVRTCPYASPRP